MLLQEFLTEQFYCGIKSNRQTLIAELGDISHF